MLKRKEGEKTKEGEKQKEEEFKCYHCTTDSVFTYDTEPEDVDTHKKAKESPSPPAEAYSSRVFWESPPKAKDVAKKDEHPTRVDELSVVGYCLDGVCGTLSSAQDAVENACCDCGSANKAKVDNDKKAPTADFLKNELKRPTTKPKRDYRVPRQMDDHVDENTSTMVIEPMPSPSPQRSKKKMLRMPFVRKLFGRRSI